MSLVIHNQSLSVGLDLWIRIPSVLTPTSDIVRFPIPHSPLQQVVVSKLERTRLVSLGQSEVDVYETII